MISLRLRKTFRNTDTPFSLDVAYEIGGSQKHVVLFGPSGSGKSLTLQCLVGLTRPDSGYIRLDERVLYDGAARVCVPARRRRIGFMFQDYALFPHLSVLQNVAYARTGCWPWRICAAERAKAQAMLERFGIGHLARHLPVQLSGGQRQRVAIGRAIVRDPAVFLMDEPLSNLDAKLRNQMRAEIIKLREKIDTTFIYVTHDQVEAMTLGDRIVIMRDGFIQQIGTPQEVFNHPANLFVAGFIGTPQMNFFDATLTKKGDKYVATVQGKDFELPADKQEALKKMDKIPTDIIAGVRPVHVHLSDDGIDATVDVSELMGSELHLHVNSNGKDVVIVVPTTDIDVGAVHGGHKPVKYSFRPELMHFFDKETEKNIF